MQIADLLRLICVVESVILVPECIWCMLGGPMVAHQRLRFSSLALIGVVVVGGQIDAWGKPLNWRTPLLVIALALAVVGMSLFLTGRRRTDRE